MVPGGIYWEAAKFFFFVIDNRSFLRSRAANSWGGKNLDVGTFCGRQIAEIHESNRL